MSGWRHPNERLASELPPELRRAGVPAAARAWIARCAGAAVRDVRRLPGASSTAVHSVRLADGRGLVLRRYVWDKFLRDEPDAPGREIAALQHAARHRLPVPLLIAADVNGSDVGDDVPAILMTRIDGRAHGSPDVSQLARLAADLHRTPTAGFDHSYFPWCRDTSTRPPTGCAHPARWERALEIWHNRVPPYEPRLIHRDFHPGNVLWLRGRLSGLVDWVNACVGPVGLDIATCRWNLADWAGIDAGDAFVASYEQLTGERHHPYWDIAGILEDDWDDIDEPDRIAQAEQFLARALSRWDGYARRATRIRPLGRAGL